MPKNACNAYPNAAETIIACLQLLRCFGLVQRRQLLLELREEVLSRCHEMRHGACVESVFHVRILAIHKRLTAFAPCSAAPVRHRVTRDLVIYRWLVYKANVSTTRAYAWKTTWLVLAVLSRYSILWLALGCDLYIGEHTLLEEFLDLVGIEVLYRHMVLGLGLSLCSWRSRTRGFCLLGSPDIARRCGGHGLRPATSVLGGGACA